MSCWSGSGACVLAYRDAARQAGRARTGGRHPRGGPARQPGFGRGVQPRGAGDVRVRQLAGRAVEPARVPAELSESFVGDPERTVVHPVRVIDGRAVPAEVRSSQVLSTSLGLDGWIVVPPGGAAAGTICWRSRRHDRGPVVRSCPRARRHVRTCAGRRLHGRPGRRRGCRPQFGDEFAELCRTCTVVVDGETVPRSEFADRRAGVRTGDPAARVRRFP